MFIKLVTHTFKSFRRSELFGKSSFMLFMIGLMVFFILTQLSLAGRLLPGILQEYLPAKTPGQWVYGMIIPLMMTDLITRLTLQTMPAQQAKPYLHLPIAKNTLSAYWMLRSWLHPINLWMLVFFRSFIQMTINPETSSQSLSLLGIFMLVAINQGLAAWLKTIRENFSRIIIMVIVMLLSVLVAFGLEPDKLMAWSLQLFLGFADGNLVIFSACALAIILLHFLAMQQAKNAFRYGSEDAQTASNPNKATGKWEAMIASVPVYGNLWLLEWRLAIRNQRSQVSFFLMLPIGIAAAISTYFIDPLGYSAYLIVVFMIAGSYGHFHLQYAYAWESQFFDMIATRNISIKDFIKAKYYFYFIYSFIQWLFVFPIVAFNNLPLALFYTGMFFFACGFGYFFYLFTGIGSSGRMDPNKRSAFNTEGVSGKKFIQTMMLFFSLLVPFIIGYILHKEFGPTLLLSLTGIGFLLTINIWSESLAKRFRSRKYRNLSIYREK